MQSKFKIGDNSVKAVHAQHADPSLEGVSRLGSRIRFPMRDLGPNRLRDLACSGNEVGQPVLVAIPAPAKSRESGVDIDAVQGL
jgi:hypothetical protein